MTQPHFSSSRRKAMDLLKLFAIFLVIWQHIILFFTTIGDAHLSPVFRAISSFNMPLFMGIVGYFGADLGKLPPKELITKKARQLLLPALSFGAVYLLLSLTVMSYLPLQEVLKSYWFLKSAFVCCLLYGVATSATRHRKLLLLLSVLFALVWPRLVYMLPQRPGYVLIYGWQLPQLYIAFVTGALLHTYQAQLLRYRKQLIIISGVIFAALVAAETISNEYRLHPVGGALIYGLTYHAILMAVVSVSFFVLTAEAVEGRLRLGAVGNRLSEWGSMTLGIYCIHVIIDDSPIAKMVDYSGIGRWQFDVMVAPLLAAVMLVICVALTRMLRANRLTAFLFLGRPYRRAPQPQPLKNLTT